MKTGVIVLSRIDSARLPEKAIKCVNNKSIIEYVVEKAKKIKNSEIIIATPDRKIDDQILDKFKDDKEVKKYKGSLEKVSHRFLECMKHYKLDVAIRLNGDSPLHSYKIINDFLEIFIQKKPDLLTNVFPRSYPVGMSIEIISLNALANACSRMTQESHFEHISKFFYENSDSFNIINISQEPINHSKVNLSVDTKEDFERFKWIINKCKQNYLNADYNELIKFYNEYENAKKF